MRLHVCYCCCVEIIIIINIIIVIVVVVAAAAVIVAAVFFCFGFILSLICVLIMAFVHFKCREWNMLMSLCLIFYCASCFQ